MSTKALADTSGRWRFLDPSIESERARRERVEVRIDAWWSEFQRRHHDISELFHRRQQWDLAEWMHGTLQAIDPRLMWEYGRAERCAGHRLVITPEADCELRPLVDTLLSRAPALESWEFYGHRLAEPIEMLQPTLEARTGGNLDARVIVQRGSHHRIDLTYVPSHPTGADDAQLRKAAFVATETLLGEALLDRWIGAIEVERMGPAQRALARWFRRDADASSVALVDLKSSVDRSIAEIRAGLASERHDRFVESAEWSSLKLEPRPAEDYPERLDLFVAVTPNLPLWKAAHADGRFYDERFSTVGETFAYVKLEASELLSESFASRAEIEDAIDSALRHEGLGCTIGGGTGRRYWYVDLAFGDVERGIHAVCARLSHADVPRRSWIQFFNADWGREWVGVYPDSPAPPMRG